MISGTAYKICSLDVKNELMLKRGVSLYCAIYSVIYSVIYCVKYSAIYCVLVENVLRFDFTHILYVKAFNFCYFVDYKKAGSKARITSTKVATGPWRENHHFCEMLRTSMISGTLACNIYIYITHTHIYHAHIQHTHIYIYTLSFSLAKDSSLGRSVTKVESTLHSTMLEADWWLCGSPQIRSLHHWMPLFLHIQTHTRSIPPSLSPHFPMGRFFTLQVLLQSSNLRKRMLHVSVCGLWGVHRKKRPLQHHSSFETKLHLYFSLQLFHRKNIILQCKIFSYVAHVNNMLFYKMAKK